MRGGRLLGFVLLGVPRMASICSFAVKALEDTNVLLPSITGFAFHCCLKLATPSHVGELRFELLRAHVFHMPVEGGEGLGVFLPFQ